ncbi:MAG: DNA polymerase I [candidate division WOR-3 bacterium]|nr:MAG: DNA polymerase I [candidate division WOR-3 bacterium]
MERKFVIIDAHSIIFRSYFAFIKHPLKNSRGENTSGIYGFLNTLEKIKKKIPTEYLILAFDAPGATFRDEIFEDYKATRPAPPADIPFQIEKVKELSECLGIPQFEVSGYEADDLLATLAVKLKEHGKVYIATSDKDLLQLIGDKVYVYDAYRDEIIDRGKVSKKYGVTPEQIPMYLALTGDTIDNVPGVPGIGPKRAQEIIKKFTDFDEALEKDPRLARHQDEARLSRELIELKTDVPLDFSIEALRMREPDMDRIMPILIDLEFHSYIKELAKGTRATIKVETMNRTGALEDSAVVGIASGDGQVFISSREDTAYRTEPERAAFILNRRETVKAGYDLKAFAQSIPIAPPLFDVQIVSWLLEPNRRSYSFEDICLQNLKSCAEPTPEAIAMFSSQLYPILKRRLEEVRMLDLYDNIEEPLIHVLAKMEKRGIGLDVVYLEELNVDVEKQLHKSEEKIYAMAGRSFNINSPKQLSIVLFDELKLKPTKRGKTHYSTDSEVLTQLSQSHGVPKEILTYRELAKIKSTYLEPLVMLSKEGRIHTTFNQTGTATGRLSSSNPNIQNIPIRSELGRRIRKGFIAQEGYTLVSADYSQIELRLLAHLTHDRKLVEAFINGDDIHRHTASVIFSIEEDEVDEKQRRMAKVVNYGLIYGMSDYGLAQSLDIPREEATQFIESYYHLYPEVARWRDEAVARAEEKGYAETMYGRKRPLPDIHSGNYNLREFSKRAAINTPIQGSAADLIKIAMIDVERRLTEGGFSMGLLLSIHDELLFEIEEHRTEEAKEMVKESMENIVKLSVPIRISIAAGRDWDKAH